MFSREHDTLDRLWAPSVGGGTGLGKGRAFPKPERRLRASLPAFPLWYFARKTLTRGQKVQLKIVQQISSIHQVHIQSQIKNFYNFISRR